MKLHERNKKGLYDAFLKTSLKSTINLDHWSKPFSKYLMLETHYEMF